MEKSPFLLPIPAPHQRYEHVSTTARRRQKCWEFIRKYFLDGQKYEDAEMLVDVDTPDSTNERKHWVDRCFSRGNKYVGMFIPIVFFHTIWWTLAWRYDLLERFRTRWQMPVTMTVGATVAGMTSEGGGAVAFPVMTLLLGIDPVVARDFSLMIQSCGMTSATFAILWSSSIRLEKSATILCSLGALVGCVVGLEFVEHLLSGPQKKMLFVSVWSSFGMALFLLNRERKRKTFAEIRHLSAWKVTVLLATGFTGGICTSFAGSGADITAFSVLTLLFRISEKVATPTSVVIMATNTCVGFFWRHCIQTGIPTLAWEYWSISVPVVVICAPMGAILASNFHRLTLAAFVYVLEALSMIGFLATGPPAHLIYTGALIILVAFAFFVALCRLGESLIAVESGPHVRGTATHATTAIAKTTERASRESG